MSTLTATSKFAQRCLNETTTTVIRCGARVQIRITKLRVPKVIRQRLNFSFTVGQPPTGFVRKNGQRKSGQHMAGSVCVVVVVGQRVGRKVGGGEPIAITVPHPTHPHPSPTNSYTYSDKSVAQYDVPRIYNHIDLSVTSPTRSDSGEKICDMRSLRVMCEESGELFAMPNLYAICMREREICVYLFVQLILRVRSKRHAQWETSEKRMKF